MLCIDIFFIRHHKNNNKITVKDSNDGQQYWVCTNNTCIQQLLTINNNKLMCIKVTKYS